MSSLGTTAVFSHFLRVRVEFFPEPFLLPGSLFWVQYSLLSHVSLPASPSLVYFLQLDTFFLQFLLHLSAFTISHKLFHSPPSSIYASVCGLRG